MNYLSLMKISSVLRRYNVGVTMDIILHTAAALTYLMMKTLMMPAMPLLTMRTMKSIHISITMTLLNHISQEWMIISDRVHGSLWNTSSI